MTNSGPQGASLLPNMLRILRSPCKGILFDRDLATHREASDGFIVGTFRPTWGRCVTDTVSASLETPPKTMIWQDVTEAGTPCSSGNRNRNSN